MNNQQLTLSADDLELVKESLSATINNLVESFPSEATGIQQHQQAIRLANKVRQVKRVLSIIGSDCSAHIEQSSVVSIVTSEALRKNHDA